ncbi:hypothetical protein [Streptomyces sp. SID4985]|uniref:hypothetical protein n=1 Tax=unclassified Streptomyces TaxID=2593676 RepID=UPI00136FB8AF|nr:hypothetical protein [Streptomyces sp. SID4985]MYQ47857.1 hypothetical protein [Streptomyces sp. SID4985]
MHYGRVTQPATFPSRSEPPDAIRDWLAGAHASPEQARREWSRCGVALLPLGPRFDAVRIPGDLLHAAVGGGDIGNVLNGPVIHDVRTLGPTYWALVPHQGDWPGDPETPLLSHGTYLGVPDLIVTGPPGSFWVTPPSRRHHLCRAEDVLALIDYGRKELGRERTTNAERLSALAQELPPPDTLSDDRLRGRSCVWCGTPLTVETAFLDFGQLLSPQRWFPRACRPCTGERTERARVGRDGRK